MSGSLIILVALFAVLWIVMIRPQRAKQQKQRELLSSVEPGDEILTVGGIYGIVQEIEDEEDGEDLIVEIAEGIHVRVARRAVATVVKPDTEDDDAADEDAEDGEDGDADGAADLDDATDPDTAPASERT
jgi:preprotein translocase subunit YajC